MGRARHKAKRVTKGGENNYVTTLPPLGAVQNPSCLVGIVRFGLMALFLTTIRNAPTFRPAVSMLDAISAVTSLVSSVWDDTPSQQPKTAASSDRAGTVILGLTVWATEPPLPVRLSPNICCAINRAASSEKIFSPRVCTCQRPSTRRRSSYRRQNNRARFGRMVCATGRA